MVETEPKDRSGLAANEEVPLPELIQLITHYSNLKFGILTVFVAATSGLFFARYGIDLVHQSQTLSLSCSISGLVVTFAFGVFDHALENAMQALRSGLRSRCGAVLGVKEENRFGPVFYASASLFVLAGVFWLLALVPGLMV